MASCLLVAFVCNCTCRASIVIIVVSSVIASSIQFLFLLRHLRRRGKRERSRGHPCTPVKGWPPLTIPLVTISLFRCDTGREKGAGDTPAPRSRAGRP